MRRLRHSAIAAAALGACGIFAPPPVYACSILPDILPAPPAGTSPEAAAKFRRAWSEATESRRSAENAVQAFEHQEKLWGESDTIILAAIEATHPMSSVRLADGRYDQILPGVDLQPLRWLKGKGAGDTFTLRYAGMTTCGLTPGWDALGGKPGETFVIYVRGETPTQGAVLDAIASDRIVERQARAILATMQ